jgi:hypothetical protein
MIPNGPLIIPTGRIYSNYDTIKIYENNDTTGNFSYWKRPVNIVSTTNIVLNGDSIYDSGQRILVTGQTDQKQNGIYNTMSGPWIRSDDMKVGISIAGTLVYVNSSPNTFYTCNNNYNLDIVGTNNLTFANLILISIGVIEDKYLNQPGGVGNSVQYASGTPRFFNGSVNFKFVRNSIDGNKLIIGENGKTTNLVSDYNLYIEAGNSSNLNIITGTGNTNSGNMLIQTGLSNTFSGDIDFITGTNSIEGSNLNITVQNIINITNDEFGNENKNVVFRAKKTDIRNHIIAINTNTKIENGGLTVNKYTTTIPVIEDFNSDNMQGYYIFQNPSSLGTSSSVTIRVNNTNVAPGQLIFLNIVDYRGTGTPVVEVYNTQSGFYEIVLMNVSTIDSFSNSPLKIGYVIFR